MSASFLRRSLKAVRPSFSLLFAILLFSLSAGQAQSVAGCHPVTTQSAGSMNFRLCWNAATQEPLLSATHLAGSSTVSVSSER